MTDDVNALSRPSRGARSRRLGTHLVRIGLAILATAAAAYVYLSAQVYGWTR